MTTLTTSQPAQAPVTSHPVSPPRVCTDVTTQHVRIVLFRICHLFDVGWEWKDFAPRNVTLQTCCSKEGAIGTCDAFSSSHPSCGHKKYRYNGRERGVTSTPCQEITISQTKYHTPELGMVTRLNLIIPPYSPPTLLLNCSDLVHCPSLIIHISILQFLTATVLSACITPISTPTQTYVNSALLFS